MVRLRLKLSVVCAFFSHPSTTGMKPAHTTLNDCLYFVHIFPSDLSWTCFLDVGPIKIELCIVSRRELPTMNSIWHPIRYLYVLNVPTAHFEIRQTVLKGSKNIPWSVLSFLKTGLAGVASSAYYFDINTLHLIPHHDWPYIYYPSILPVSNRRVQTSY